MSIVTQGPALSARHPTRFAFMHSITTPATVMMGPAEGITATIVGTLNSAEQYNTLVAWWQNTRRVDITDKLGRVYTILIVEFDAQRIRSANQPWKHNWTMTVDVLQVVFPAHDGGDPLVLPNDYLTWSSAEGSWADHYEASL